MLDAFNDDAERSPPFHLLDQLRDESWLLTAEGSPVRPGDVIGIEGLDDEAQRLLADERLAGAFTSLADLHTDVKEHSALGRLRSLKVLPDRRASLEVLAMCLAEVPAYRVGQLAELPAGADTLRILLTAFSGVPDHVLPVIPLLSRLVDAFDGDHQVVADKVLVNIRQALPIEMRHPVRGVAGRGDRRRPTPCRARAPSGARLLMWAPSFGRGDGMRWPVSNCPIGEGNWCRRHGCVGTKRESTQALWSTPSRGTSSGGERRPAMPRKRIPELDPLGSTRRS